MTLSGDTLLGDDRGSEGRVDIGEDGFSVPAELLAEHFKLPAAEIPHLMRAGEITSRCETGQDEDEGRFRLTFFHRNARLRLIVDRAGVVLQRAMIDFGDRELPPDLRR